MSISANSAATILDPSPVNKLFNFPKLIDDPSAWNIYRTRLLALVASKDPNAYLIATDEYKKEQAVTKAQEKVYKKANTVLWACIIGTVSSELLHYIDDVTPLDGKAAFSNLKDHFEASTPAKIRVLMIDLLNPPNLQLLHRSSRLSPICDSPQRTRLSLRPCTSLPSPP